MTEGDYVVECAIRYLCNIIRTTTGKNLISGRDIDVLSVESSAVQPLASAVVEWLIHVGRYDDTNIER